MLIPASFKSLDRGDWEGVGELLLSSARTLERAGADFLVCPDNTIHQASTTVSCCEACARLDGRPCVS